MLRNKRKELGINQQKMGELIGVSKTTVCAWETKLKSPTLDKMQLIINAYKLTDLEVLELIKEFAKEI